MEILELKNKTLFYYIRIWNIKQTNKTNLTAPIAGCSIFNTVLMVLQTVQPHWQFLKWCINQSQGLSHFTPRYLQKINKSICPHKGLYTNVSAVLFAIVPNQKEHTCSSAGEWVDRVWCIHAMGYYSLIKRNTSGWISKSLHWEKPDTKEEHTLVNTMILFLFNWCKLI